MLMETAREDVRSVTGSNYRNIMLLTEKNKTSDIGKGDAEDINYHKLDPNEAWKVGIIKEIIGVKHGMAKVPGFEDDELDTLLNHLCTV